MNGNDSSSLVTVSSACILTKDFLCKRRILLYLISISLSFVSTSLVHACSRRTHSPKSGNTSLMKVDDESGRR